ncbi:MAG: tape measure protein [Mixta calida]|nr:tape measure protein [Mixta calida]MDU4943759.1 tape measure protein [Mixta calida]
MAEKVGEIYYEIEADTSKLISAQKQVNKSVGQIGSDLDKTSKNADRFQSSLNKVGAAIAAAFTVDAAKRLLDIADQMNILQARIARLSPSVEVARQTMASLSAIASQTGSSLSDTERLWESLTSALKETGATNNQIVALTSTLQKIGTIGGSSADEMSNALRQFGQSIAGGVVRAEEFNSILEQMPELARQIAAGMGISIGELRKRMLDGKLTAEDALNAIQKQSATVSAEFAKMPRTMQQATNSLEISFQTLIKNVNDATGASQTMVMIVDSLTMALDRLMGKSSTAAQQISDLTSTAEMFERRARTWSWLGLDGWEAQNKALAGLSNKAAALIQDMDVNRHG